MPVQRAGVLEQLVAKGAVDHLAMGPFVHHGASVFYEKRIMWGKSLIASYKKLTIKSGVS